MSLQVRIDRGPITPELPLAAVPQDKWTLLLHVRRDHIARTLPYDCRQLLTYVRDAERMWQPLGFVSLDALIEEALGLDPERVRWALDGLKKWRPDEAISYEDAQALGQHGGDRRSEKAKAKDQGCSTTLKRGTAAHWLARLDRDHRDELAARVRAGELSAHAAAIEAGFRRRTITVPRDVAGLARALRRVLTPDELRRLVRELGA